MSLAMYAAPIDDNNAMNGNVVQQRKQTHSQTQKRYPKQEDAKVNTDRVNSVLSNIHDSMPEDQDQPILGDFNPPPPPESAGVNRTESMQSMNSGFKGLVGRSPEPNNESQNDFDVNNINSNYGDDKSVEDYYNKMLPGYKNSKNFKNFKNAANKPYYKGSMEQQSYSSPSEDVVMQKLNYMINLLEEQQDVKTNNVTEEVVLYSFLGIFIIFVVDSFARAGKYVR